MLRAMNFLIRTKENRISGPYPKETIVARVHAGELGEMDEVCPATGYWIYLHEREESMKLLGVCVARNDEFHDDSTETDTETVTATQPVDMARVHRPAVSRPVQFADPVQPPTANRPEPMRAWVLLLWLIVVMIGFILYRVYQVAWPL